jgi:hypothetical protein
VRDIQYLVPFVRPWDLPFFVELARAVRTSRSQEDLRIRYLTMWKEGVEILNALRTPEEEVYFVPRLLAETRISDEDKQRLAAVERQMRAACGTPLKVMLDAERFRPRGVAATEDFMWRHFKVFEEIIPERAVVFSNAVDHLCYWLACDLARMRGGQYVGLCLSGRPSTGTQVLANATDLWMPYEAKSEHRAEVEKQVREIRAGVKPDYMTAAYGCRLPFARKLLIRWRQRAEKRSGNYFGDASLSNLLFARPQMYHERIRWARIRTRIPFRPLAGIREEFVYLPLHYEPEASTLVYSPFLHDQAFWIATVAKALPAHMALVIKENPKMWGARPLSFYAGALEHPGVVWIDPTTPTEALTQRAAAVLTLTGTVAIEAAALGKPTAFFGKPPCSSALKCIPRIERLTDLPQTLEEMIGPGRGPDREQFAEEFATYIANLVPRRFRASHVVDWASCPIVPYAKEYGTFVSDVLSNSSGGGTTAVASRPSTVTASGREGLSALEQYVTETRVDELDQ